MDVQDLKSSAETVHSKVQPFDAELAAIMGGEVSVG